HRPGGPGPLAGAGAARRAPPPRRPRPARRRRSGLRVERDLPAVGGGRRAVSLDVAATRARLTPDAPALLWQRRWLTYAELDDRAERLAAALRAAGVGKGDRVALLAHNHVAHVDMILATAKTGVVYTPRSEEHT